MTDKERFLQNLRSLADAVVAMFGRNCEACVHDLTSLRSSLVYIQGDVTHRRPGAPATDLLVKMINSTGETGDVHSYRTTSSEGRSLKSTTTLIRDGDGRAVAAFCINFDTTEFYNVGQALLPFIGTPEIGAPPSPETFAHSAGETVDALFHNAVLEIGKHQTTMNVDERKRLIAALDADGLFQFKGAVEQVAKMMGITRFTVYNYLKKARSTDTTQQKEEHQ
ncbi:MAG: PAS domain-containing protein [Proteobacteria bacterium]|nr:PAS domain-containing protein [Pseudomonadota bacterium]